MAPTKRLGPQIESDRKKRRRSHGSDNEQLSNRPSDSEAASYDDDVEEDSSSGTSGEGFSDNDDDQPPKAMIVPHPEGETESDDELLECTTPNTSRISIKPRQDVPQAFINNIKRAQPTGIPVSAPPPLALDFGALGVSTALVSSLGAMSIRKPTPVQVACIPQLLKGQDCVGNAKTGSGKTVGFAVPILQQLAKDPYGIFALVLTPTRELAFQIADQFTVIGAPLDVRTTVVVGGMDMMSQMIAMNERPHVVVATPGRLVDLIRESSGQWSLGKIKFLVLDEADRLLGSTFASDLAVIFSKVPQSRQTCLFTATLTPTIEALALSEPRPGKQRPYVFRDSDSSETETVDTLKQQYILCPSHIREVYLNHLLRNPPESILHLRRDPPVTDLRKLKNMKPRKPKRGEIGVVERIGKGKQAMKNNDDDGPPTQPPPTIIFVTKSQTAEYLTILLKQLGFRATALHSRLSQPKRLSSLGIFRAHVVPILICTDVGARGLDMDNVGMVINWDLPQSPKRVIKVSGENGEVLKMPPEMAPPGAALETLEGFQAAEDTYVHRVGRTARMGRGGVAVSFVTEKKWDADTVNRIEERISENTIPHPSKIEIHDLIRFIETKLTELQMDEDTVLEELNTVMGAKRVALMELEHSDFGKREANHQKVKENREGKEAAR
ncbi:putative RNA helicase [Tulasnella sp. JGI-2019a]|nr:putative RNA helicase [Tulasnella sp. JGI-2019a]